MSFHNSIICQTLRRCLGNELFSYLTSSFNLETDVPWTAPSRGPRLADMKHVVSALEGALSDQVDKMVEDGKEYHEVMMWRQRVDPMLDIAIEKLQAEVVH